MVNQDNMDLKEPVNGLSPYTLEELSLINLPQKLAEHTNEVELEQEKEPYEQTINNLVEVSRELNSHMAEEKYAFTGSMSMYALWNDLMEKSPDINIRRILNQRIKGGKNDFDIAITEARKEVVMTEKLKFDDDAKAKQRGVIGNHMVDIQVRPVMNDFPYKEVQLGDQRVFVQNPVVGIFERMSALAYPQIGNDGKDNPKEIKWGVDTKLLKLYVMLSENLTEDQLEEKLKNLWDKYQEGKRYEYAEYLASQVKLGKDPKELLLPSINKLLKESISTEDLQEKIKGIFPNVPLEVINTMLYTGDDKVFLNSMKEVIDLVTPKPDTHEEMCEKANENYFEISPS
jgi:hypothetical protein